MDKLAVIGTVCGRTPEEQLDAAVRANVRVSVDRLRRGSRILEELAHEGQIAIVGAVYHLSSRRVEFLELPDELLRAAGDLGDLGVRPSASPGADGRSSARSGLPPD